jgi:hypothetical protein
MILTIFSIEILQEMSGDFLIIISTIQPNRYIYIERESNTQHELRNVFTQTPCKFYVKHCSTSYRTVHAVIFALQ